MGRMPVLWGLLAAGLLLPGCDWCGRCRSLTSGRTSAPAYATGTPPGSTAPGWNNGERLPAGSANSPGTASRMGTPGGNPAGYNSTGGAGYDRNSGVLANPEYNPGNTARKAADPGVVRTSGPLTDGTRQPVTNASGDVGTYRAPSEQPPALPEPARPETGTDDAPELSRPSGPPTTRPE